MPLFLHILFWGLAVVTVILGLIYTFYAWAGGFLDDEYEDWIIKHNQLDHQSTDPKPNFWRKNSRILGFLISVGVTLGWVLLVAAWLQGASWIYGWGV